MRQFTAILVGGSLFLVAACISLQPTRDRELGSLSEEEVFPLFRDFALETRATPDLQFATVNRDQVGAIRFSDATNEWKAWDEKGCELFHEEGGYRMFIRLNSESEIERTLAGHRSAGRERTSMFREEGSGKEKVFRLVKCGRFKTSLHYEEYRYYSGLHETYCVHLTAFAFDPTNSSLEKPTPAHLIVKLRSQYGKYEGICQQVSDLIASGGK